MLWMYFLGLFLMFNPYAEADTLTVTANYNAHIFEEGQSATLKCEAVIESRSVTWERSEWNGTWHKVATGNQLVLSRKEDSGVYRCHQASNATSLPYQVYFLSTPYSGSWGLAAAALVLSLLTLFLFTALVLWLWLHRVKETSSSTNKTADPNDYGPKNTHSPAVDDGDIYMNTLEIEQAYSDLNPRAEDQSYATLETLP